MHTGISLGAEIHTEQDTVIHLLKTDTFVKNSGVLTRFSNLCCHLSRTFFLTIVDVKTVEMRRQSETLTI